MCRILNSFRKPAQALSFTRKWKRAGKTCRQKKLAGTSHNPHPEATCPHPTDSTSSTGGVNAGRIMHSPAKTFNNLNDANEGDLA